MFEPRSSPSGQQRVPCWLCGWPVVVRADDREDIELVCMDCGMQVVIHSATGAKRLRALVDREGPETGRSSLKPRGALAG